MTRVPGGPGPAPPTRATSCHREGQQGDRFFHLDGAPQPAGLDAWAEEPPGREAPLPESGARTAPAGAAPWASSRRVHMAPFPVPPSRVCGEWLLPPVPRLPPTEPRGSSWSWAPSSRPHPCGHCGCFSPQCPGLAWPHGLQGPPESTRTSTPASAVSLPYCGNGRWGPQPVGGGSLVRSAVLLPLPGAVAQEGTLLAPKPGLVSPALCQLPFHPPMDTPAQPLRPVPQVLPQDREARVLLGTQALPSGLWRHHMEAGRSVSASPGRHHGPALSVFTASLKGGAVPGQAGASGSSCLPPPAPSVAARVWDTTVRSSFPLRRSTSRHLWVGTKDTESTLWDVAGLQGGVRGSPGGRVHQEL